MLKDECWMIIAELLCLFGTFFLSQKKYPKKTRQKYRSALKHTNCYRFLPSHAFLHHTFYNNYRLFLV